MEYQGISLRNKNNFNKGFSYLAKEGTARYDRMSNLDNMNVNASDRLKMEQVRGEKIDYDNAVGFHERMEAAMNANADDKYGYKDGQKRSDYRFHFDSDKVKAEASESLEMYCSGVSEMVWQSRR